MSQRSLSALSCAVILSSFLASAATAGIINVPADHTSIQAAIVAAVDTDEIVVAPGTYVETIDFLGKAITLRSSDGAAAQDRIAARMGFLLESSCTFGYDCGSKSSHCEIPVLRIEEESRSDEIS